MRALALVLLFGTAHADGIGANAALGAGGQGTATYSAIEAGVDGLWRGARIGLGARGVWINGTWRDRDFERPRDAVRVLRLLEVSAGAFALAAGGLAPAQIAHVADGHRAGLDDRPRTGVRAAAGSASAEIDDVLDPSLIGGAITWDMRAWRAHVATANDPRGLSEIELAIGKRVAMAEIGAGFVGEPQLGGAQAIAFGELRGDGWFATAEARAGSGTVGGAFGPLHRLEREMWTSERGVGGALGGGVFGRWGWARASVRARPQGAIAMASAGAPVWRWLQAGAWIAASRHAAAGASEVRIAWARRYATKIELARMYDTDAAMPTPVWSATAWFGITTD